MGGHASRFASFHLIAGHKSGVRANFMKNELSRRRGDAAGKRRSRSHLLSMRSERFATSAVIFCALILVAGCASLSGERLARSSHGCMETVVREKVPSELPEKRKHCVAAGLIARYCSVSEAYLAGAAKELSDLFASGDAAWSDWRADRAGVRCAKQSQSDSDVADCCTAAGY